MIRTTWLILGLVTIAAGVVRLYGLGDRCLWGDEVLAWRMAQFPVPELIHRVTNPSEGDNPPLYFLMLHFWCQWFGDSEASMRLLAALPGTAAVPVCYLFVRELCRVASPQSPARRESVADWIGVAGATLLATSELQIHCSRQVRMYGLGTLLNVAAAWLLLRALRGRGGRWAWPAYGAVAVALCYTHNTATFSVSAHLVYAALYLALSSRGAGELPERRVGGFLGTSLGIVVACLPLALILAQRAHTAHDANAWMGPLRYPWSGEQVIAALTSEEVTRELKVVEWGIAAGLCAAGLVYLLCAREGWAGGYLLVTTGIPAAAMIGYALESGISLVVARYLLFAQASWLAGIAILMGRLSTGRVGWVCLWCAAVCWAYICAPQWESVADHDAAPGMRDAAKYLADHREAHEPVLNGDHLSQFKLAYNLRGDPPARLVAAPPSPIFQQASAYFYAGEIVPPYEVAEKEYASVWVVSSGDGPPDGRLPFLLAGRWRLTDTAVFRQDYRWEKSIQIRRFQRQTPSTPPP